MYASVRNSSDVEDWALSKAKVVGFVLGFKGCTHYPELVAKDLDFPLYAACAAQRFTEATGFECRVFNTLLTGAKPKDYWEMMQWRYRWPKLMPDADIAISVDADTVWMRAWDPRPMMHDIASVRGPSWWMRAWANNYVKVGVRPDEVVSGGGWVATQAAAHIFEEVLDLWSSTYDTVQLSRIIQKHEYPVHWLPQTDLAFRIGPLSKRIGTKAYHLGQDIYTYWDTGHRIEEHVDLPWNLHAMAEHANVERRADGTAMSTRGWFISKDHVYRYDPRTMLLCP